MGWNFTKVAMLIVAMAVSAQAVVITSITVDASTEQQVTQIDFDTTGDTSTDTSWTDWQSAVLTGWSGSTNNFIYLYSTETTPVAGTRSAIVADSRVFTGLVNVPEVTFTFTTPITDDAGAEIVLMDLGGGDNISITINGVTRGVGDLSDGWSGTLTNSGDNLELFNNNTTAANTIDSLTELETSDAVVHDPSNRSFDSTGLAIDLADFGAVGPVTQITIDGASSFDPSMVVGYIPEPASLLLVGAGLMVGLRRR